METASSTLQILPSTKDEVFSFARKIESELVSGEVNPLDLLRFKKCFDKIFETVKPVLDEYSREEAEKHGKSFVYHGLKIELAENGTQYDYSKCGDPELKRLTEKAEKVNRALKDRQTFLKGIKGSISIADEETGEICTVYPPLKTSTSGLKCSLD